MAFIKIEFEVEVDCAIWFAYNVEQEERQKRDYSNINVEMQQILDEMNCLARGIGKNYDILITGYNFPDEKAKANEV
jgi:hypothetical protein